MKIAVINNSGNVGKTTITREVLAQNLENPVLVEIETHNAGNEDFSKYFADYKKFNADEVDEFYEIIAMNENVVVDVGASNMQDFFAKLTEYGIESIFDAIVIPVTADIKQIKDTLKTISLLNDLGFDNSKIFVIANRIKNLGNFEKDFGILLKASSDLQFNCNKDLTIKETSIFKDLEILNKTLKDVLDDETDYIQLAKDDEENKKKYIKMDLIKRAGKRLHTDLKRIFNQIQTTLNS